MATLPATPPRNTESPYRHFLAVSRFILALTLTAIAWPGAYADTHTDATQPQQRGMFLVATGNLDGTSFQQAVILMTHYSPRGATGLTINRPSNISLKQAFPQIDQLQQRSDPLYLGGPVNTNAIFVLVHMDTPPQNMHLIANNIYFSTAKNAFRYPLTPDSRTYAGYAGWGAGQLQQEIDRGDWLLVHTPADIIFEQAPERLWQTLYTRWSGNWI